MKNKTEVNKCTYELDTEDRILEYDAKRAFGWEKEYKIYRDAWHNNPKNLDAGMYPLNVDLEMTAICNLKCPMCFLQSPNMEEIKGERLINPDLFKKIVDEMAEANIPALRLNFRGEPTLHPNFIELIKYAKEKGIKEICMNTNGSKLNPEFFEQMAPYLDWIVVSIDGLDETYEKIRKPIKFNSLLENLSKTIEIKKKLNLKRPVIKAQTIWTAIEHDPEAYYNRLAPHVDLVGYSPTYNYDEAYGTYDSSLYENKEEFACPTLYQRLLILSNGKSVLCCTDSNSKCIVGDANTQTIKEIWNGKVLSNIRKLHENGNYDQVALCKTCCNSRKMEDLKTISINNRNVTIKNYKE